MSATIATERVAGRLGAELRGRLDAAVTEAQRLLGREPEPVGPEDTDRLGELIDALSERSEGDAGGAQAEVEAHRVALARLRSRFAARTEALEAARRAVAQLRAITSPAQMLARAPEALARAWRLERVLLTLTTDGRLIPESAHVDGDPGRAAAALAALRERPIALEHPLIETELLRRRRATIVDGARVAPRVDPGLVEAMDWDAYVAAPLVVGPHVIGMVHAGCGRDGPGHRLDVLDRDVLWEFTSLLAQAYESASLRRALRHEREQTREFLDWLGARSGELIDAPVRLATMQRPPRPLPAAADVSARAGAPGLGPRDDRRVFEGLLTRRELDVLRLLAEGHSNRRIAEALVISDGTVKFHVNSILRKLRVANRAEAVARYLRLLGMRAP